MIVVWRFLAVPWVCLQFVIVVFPDHTHLLFLVEVYLVMLHAKYQGSWPCGFRQEDFSCVPYISLYKAGAFFAPRASFNKLGRGTLDYATYHISRL